MKIYLVVTPNSEYESHGYHIHCVRTDESVAEKIANIVGGFVEEMDDENNSIPKPYSYEVTVNIKGEVVEEKEIFSSLYRREESVYLSCNSDVGISDFKNMTFYAVGKTREEALQAAIEKKKSWMTERLRTKKDNRI